MPPTSPPSISVVVPVRGRARALRDLLGALDAQVEAPPFEVLVVDDGSEPPVEIDREYSFPLQVTRQLPMATSAARNRGVRDATGEVVLFTESDCLPEPDSLSELWRATSEFPDDQAFQLDLSSREENYVQRLEGLRLHGIQAVTRREGGNHTGFANTSGFAVRRDWLGNVPPIDSAHLRGEDTGLLMRLVKDGAPPRHLKRARIVHLPDLTTWQFIRKHFWIGYRAGLARSEMRESEVQALSGGERRRMYVDIHREARARGYGPAHLLIFGACYVNELVGRCAHVLFGLRRHRIQLGPIAVDPLRQTDLFAQAFQAAERNRPLLIAGVNRKTLHVARRDSRFSEQLRGFDVLYASDDSVRRKLWWRKLRRTHTINAQPMVKDLRLEARRRGIQFAHVDAGLHKLKGGEPYLFERLKKEDPRLILVSGKSPAQEGMALRMAVQFPRSVIWCIGSVQSAQD